MTDRLQELAVDKANEYARRPGTVAVAITGSIARGMVWAGSDIDLWVFVDGPEAFEDGLASGVYWEADIRPASWLEQETGEGTWQQPPALGQRGDGLFEALWGCRVVFDPSGRLSRLQAEVDARAADRAWLERRAALYLAYGWGCLEALQHVAPLRAIVAARAVATDYGIAAHWMRQGRLLTSGCRIPELLADAPRLQHLYAELFALRGKEGAEEMLLALQQLPPAIQEQVRSDLELEVIPVFRLGYYDGGVRYLRQGMAEWFRPEEVRPVLALEADLEAQKQRALAQAREILLLA